MNNNLLRQRLVQAMNTRIAQERKRVEHAQGLALELRAKLDTKAREMREKDKEIKALRAKVSELQKQLKDRRRVLRTPR